MATEKTPVYLAYTPSSTVSSINEFQAGDVVGFAHGGTGLTALDFAPVKHTQYPSSIILSAVTAGATNHFSSLQDVFNCKDSAYYCSGGTIYNPNTSAGTFNVSAAIGLIKTANGGNNPSLAYYINGSSNCPLTEGYNQVKIYYNNGTPKWIVATSENPDHYDTIPVGVIYKENHNGVPHLTIMQGGHKFSNFEHNIQKMLIQTFGLVRTAGCVITESTLDDLALALTAGTLYKGTQSFSISSLDTGDGYFELSGASGTNVLALNANAGDQTAVLQYGRPVVIDDSTRSNNGAYHVSSYSFDGKNTILKVTPATLTTGADTGDIHFNNFQVFWYDGSAWQDTHTGEIDNTNYNSLTTSALAALTANRYGVHWIFLLANGELVSVYGQADYTLALAEDAVLPASLPDIISETGVSIAKVIVQKSATSFTSVTYPFDTRFAAGTVDNHNDLGGLQGGTTSQYYHMTLAQHTSATAAIPASFNTLSANYVAHAASNAALSSIGFLTWDAGGDLTESRQVISSFVKLPCSHGDHGWTP